MIFLSFVVIEQQAAWTRNQVEDVDQKERQTIDTSLVELYKILNDASLMSCRTVRPSACLGSCKVQESKHSGSISASLGKLGTVSSSTSISCSISKNVVFYNC